MARCGCNTAMSTTCDAIMACIAANLGRGLDYNETTGEIDLRISTDPGNGAGLGTDDGVYVGAPVPPGEITWPATVATLPAQAISANGGSNLVGPSTAPELIEYSIANGIDMYATSTHGVADGTMFEQVGRLDRLLTTYTDNPGNIEARYISSLTMQQLNYDAGTRVNPSGRNSDAPPALLTPDGGWGGFYAPNYKPRTIDEMLRQVRGRIVVDLLVQRVSLTTEQIEADIRATVEAVVQAGAQEWCIIEIPALLADNSRAPIDDWIPIITDAGIAAGINSTSEWQMVAPFTGAEMVASGATWVTVRTQSVPDGADDTRITELVTAGLQVIAYTSARQYWTTHAFGLGVRVVRSADAVYARGGRGEAGDLDYRNTLIPGLATRTTAIGALTSITDVETAMWHPGFARADLPGRWFPPRYAWVGGVSRFGNSQILGEISPIPNTTNFELRLRIRRHGAPTVSTSRFGGIFWGSDHDRDISNTPGQGSNVLRDGYGCIVREPSGASVRMGVYRYDNGVETALSTTAGGPGWQDNVWITLIVTVSGAAINFQAVGPSTSASLGTSDGTYRGPYCFYFWNDPGTGSATQYHGYNNYDLGAVPYIYQSN